jgi:hypothetical protein
MRVPRQAILLLEGFEVGKTRALFSQPVCQRWAVGDQDLLPLEADLLQIVVELGRKAALLLRLDLLRELLKLGFGFGVLLVEILLQPQRYVRKPGRRRLKPLRRGRSVCQRRRRGARRAGGRKEIEAPPLVRSSSGL